MQYHLLVLTTMVAIVEAEYLKCSMAFKMRECDEHKSRLFNTTVCETFCDNTSPGYCRIKHGPTCVCGPGYARESTNGKCIPLSKCIETYPPNCGPNEVLTTCASVCPRACLGKNTTEDLARCSLCLTGCVCKPGYIKVVKGGTCVPEHHCSMICRDNEIYDECGSACPLTCQNLGPSCTKACEKGCFCKNGFIRDTVTGLCVPNRCC